MIIKHMKIELTTRLSAEDIHQMESWLRTIIKDEISHFRRSNVYRPSETTTPALLSSKEAAEYLRVSPVPSGVSDKSVNSAITGSVTACCIPWKIISNHFWLVSGLAEVGGAIVSHASVFNSHLNSHLKISSSAGHNDALSECAHNV